MTYLLTGSGKRFSYENPQPESITIQDIARALSRESRFNGHTGEFYSVAQHSVHASKLVPLEVQLEALLHDASEAYLKDLPSPLKRLLPDYQMIERRVDAVIRAKFELPFDKSPAVKIADRIMLATERRDLMPPVDDCWPCLEGIAPLPVTIQPWSSSEAEEKLLDRFRALYFWEV
jgi:hypothetical protein